MTSCRTVKAFVLQSRDSGSTRRGDLSTGPLSYSSASQPFTVVAPSDYTLSTPVAPCLAIQIFVELQPPAGLRWLITINKSCVCGPLVNVSRSPVENPCPGNSENLETGQMINGL